MKLNPPPSSDFLAPRRGCPLLAVTSLQEARLALLETAGARASMTRPEPAHTQAEVGFSRLRHTHTHTHSVHQIKSGTPVVLPYWVHGGAGLKQHPQGKQTSWMFRHVSENVVVKAARLKNRPVFLSSLSNSSLTQFTRVSCRTQTVLLYLGETC